LDEPEHVDSVLTFSSGYDTLEYSWVKAIAVSMRLQILFMMLQSTNTHANGGGHAACFHCKKQEGDVVSHHYTTSLSPLSDNATNCFRVVGVRNPRGGYGKGLFPALSPREKGEAESVASTPKRVKRNLTPPPITRPSGQYESEEEKVLKGPKVIQLLRTVVALKKENWKQGDWLAEMSLKLKSVKDDFETLRRGLCSRISHLEKGKDIT
jgi:hypothetical protein